MKPKPTPSIVQKLDNPRIIGTLTTRSNKPGYFFSGVMSRLAACQASWYAA
jgi:hypothetical protein